MNENSGRRPPARPEVNDEILLSLMRDLTMLSRAQARLLRDLLRLVERTQEVSTETAVQNESPAADKEEREEPEGPSPVADAGTPGAPEQEVASAPPEGSEDLHVEIPVGAAERAILLREGPEEGTPPGNGRATLGVALSEGSERDRDASGDASDDDDEVIAEEAPVLILESGDARVGVLWDHVIQIGSLGASTIPERVETERGTVDLVSLGLLLHGVSLEEKYFVVLEQDGERAAVACERMLGVGPMGAAVDSGRDARIQVLRVPVLRTFAANPRSGEEAVRSDEQRAEDERDRNGPFRALVAVRYLPARVAICRHLRGRGWQVGEAAGIEAATVSLDLGRWDLLFLEAHGNGESETAESDLLRRVREHGVPVIRVGSRISGFPGREGPALMFPFSEPELDAILLERRSRGGS